jgi:Lar family restriction alleviation protein
VSDLIKPCPFCGGAAEYKSMDENFKPVNQVICHSCGFGNRDTNGWRKLKKQAIDHWNRRYDDSRVTELEGFISGLWNVGISEAKYLADNPEEIERIEGEVTNILAGRKHSL